MKKKKPKKISLIILMIIIFLLGIFIGSTVAKNSNKMKNNTSEETTQIVEIDVGTQTIENTLTSSGEISSSGKENLTLSTSKYFNTMCVEEDDIVKAGENILEYTDGTYLTAEYDCLINSYSVPETKNKCTSSNYVEVQNLQTMLMNIQVSEDEINKIEKGQEVEMELSAIEDKTYEGTIKSINSVGTYSTSGTTFSAVIEFENDGNAKIGMSASCTIILEKAENCIAIPIEAVQVSDNQKYVVVVNDDGSTKNVNIETGISNDEYVQIISGLSGGEKIQMVETVSSNSGGMMNFQRGGNMNFQGEGEMPQDIQMPGNGEMPQDIQIPGNGEMPNNN